MNEGRPEMNDVSNLKAQRISWAHQLDAWRNEAGWSQATLAKNSGLAKRTIQNCLLGETSVQKKTSGRLITALYDARSFKTREKLWQRQEQIFDWMALLNMPPEQVVAITPNKKIRDWLHQGLVAYTQRDASPTSSNSAADADYEAMKDIKEDADEEILSENTKQKERMFIAPWPVVILPASHISRDVEAEVIKQLLHDDSQGKTTPRVIALTGQKGSGKTTLAGMAIQRTIVKKHFERGCVWLKDIGENEDWVQRLGWQVWPGEEEIALRDSWQHWLASAGKKLIVLDEMVVWRFVEEILEKAGPGTRILTTTSDETRMKQKMVSWLRSGEVVLLAVGELSEGDIQNVIADLQNESGKHIDPKLWSFLSREVKHIGLLQKLITLGRFNNWEQVGRVLKDKHLTGRELETTLLKYLWKGLSKAEKVRLLRLNYGLKAEGTFGGVYSGVVWKTGGQQAQEELAYLSNTVWIEEVVEVGWGKNVKVNAAQPVKRYHFSSGVVEWLQGKRVGETWALKLESPKWGSLMEQIIYTLSIKNWQPDQKPSDLWLDLGVVPPGKVDLRQIVLAGEKIGKEAGKTIWGEILPGTGKDPVVVREGGKQVLVRWQKPRQALPLMWRLAPTWWMRGLDMPEEFYLLLYKGSGGDKWWMIALLTLLLWNDNL